MSLQPRCALINDVKIVANEALDMLFCSLRNKLIILFIFLNMF